MTVRQGRAPRRSQAAAATESSGAEGNVVSIVKSASATSDRINRDTLDAAKHKLIAKRFGPDEKPAEAGKTQTLAEDPWSSLSISGKLIEPPFDMLTLAMLPEHSSELGQCVEAMQANIDCLGHRQVSRVKLDDPKEPPPPELKTAVIKERTWLINFFEYATGDISFTEFRKRLRKDLETTGNFYFEVIRDALGQIQQFQHIPGYQMRLSRMDEEPIQYDRPILRLQEDGSVVVEKVKEWKRFRRYAQGRVLTRRSGADVVGSKVRWFKAFGDPRDVHMDTGEYGTASAPIPANKRASEIWHSAIYSARSAYGMPRFIGNLLSIYGDRAAEEINYTTFRNNNIPSMLIMVTNGQLTEGSIKRLESFVESQIQGSDNYSKFVIVEAERAGDETGEDAGQMKITVEKMSKDQHNDALFQKYSENNQDKIRRAYRLPPLLVGRAQDYTRATANASVKVADEQVFAPERNEFDSIFNRMIYPAMGVCYHKFKTNTPNTTDNETVVALISASEKTGGMTPRIARNVLEEVLSQDLGGFPEDFPADVPFSLTMAEAVKNMAQPSEPGQQVTALKVLKALVGDAIPDELVPGDDPVVRLLKSLGADMESDWIKQLKVASSEHAPHAAG